MISELTEAQERQADIYAEEWTRRGLCEGNLPDAEISGHVEAFIKGVLGDNVKTIHVCASPAAAWKKVCEIAEDPDMEFVQPYVLGHFDAGLIGQCAFYLEVLKINDLPELKAYMHSEHFGPLYPLGDAAVVSKRPIKIQTNEAGDLHCEDGPAVEYEDGFSVYALNGVRLSDHIVTTPAELLDSKLILTERNAEIRREIVRKIGIDRVCAGLDTRVVDSAHGYELLELEGVGGNPRYLRMNNPSLPGVVHLEGVPEETATIIEALNFRTPEKLRSLPIDEADGADWYQQGDVVIWPESAISRKQFPIILT